MGIVGITVPDEESTEPPIGGPRLSTTANNIEHIKALGRPTGGKLSPESFTGSSITAIDTNSVHPFAIPAKVVAHSLNVDPE
jgi:hypothetical protein